MIDPDSQYQSSDQRPIDRVPDSLQYHAHARHLRRMAISAAVSALWRRLRAPGAIGLREAGFWKA